MLTTTPVTPLRKKKTLTGWPRPTGPSLTSRGVSMSGESVSDLGEAALKHGMFAVLGETATMSTLSAQAKPEGMQFVDIVTKSGENLHLTIPVGEDRMKFVKRALELMEQGETKGAIIIRGDM